MLNLKNVFWSGLKAFVPIVLTIAIVIWVLSGIEAFFGYFLRHVIPSRYYFDGLGILVGIAFIFILGLLVKSWVLRKVYRMADRVVKRIPIIKTIYRAIQDLLNFFDKSREAQQAVLVQTPLGKMVGFVTRETLTNHQPVLGTSDEVLVYIPLSYIIGGVTMIVSKKAIVPLDWPVNEAMSFIITAGMGRQK